MHFVAVIYILHFVLLSLSSCDFKAVRFRISLIPRPSPNLTASAQKICWKWGRPEDEAFVRHLEISTVVREKPGDKASVCLVAVVSLRLALTTANDYVPGQRV